MPAPRSSDTSIRRTRSQSSQDAPQPKRPATTKKRSTTTKTAKPPVIKQHSTNVDCVKIIASYMTPNPVELTRLAAVNRDFYTIFTADEMWLRFDVYGRKKDICHHFLDNIQPYGELMVLCWADKKNKLHEFPIEKVENKYLQLGYYKALLQQSLDRNKPLKNTVIHDKALVERLINLDGFRYASPELQDNEAMAFAACAYSNFNMLYVSDRVLGEKFICALIDESLNGGAVPYPKVRHKMYATKEMIKYAWSVNPRVLSFWMSVKQDRCPIIDMIKEINPTKAQLVKAISGASQALDYFPEHWQDHEFCLTAFDAKGFYQYRLPVAFLRQCEDRKIIAKAIDIHPMALLLVSDEFRKDTKLVMLALHSSSTRNILTHKDWENHIDKVAQLPWTDGEFIARIVDMGKWDIAHKYASDKMERYCDDAKWVKERLQVQPNIWNKISMRLQKDRSLLMTALESKRRISELSEYKRGYMKADFTLKYLPVKFYNDEELLREAARADVLGNISENDMNEEMVKARMIAFLSGGTK